MELWTNDPHAPSSSTLSLNVRVQTLAQCGTVTPATGSRDNLKSDDER